MLGLTLPFATAADRFSSEHVLKHLLGFSCMVNHRYLLRHPDTKRLYDSGIVYSLPDQQTAPRRVSGSGIQRIESTLRAEGADKHTIDNVLRILNGVEEFLDIPELYARGHGDCNELVPVRVAELWRAGIDAEPRLVRPSANSQGGLTYHTVVYYPNDDSHEDPSIILGMGGKSRAAERREEIRKNYERLDNYMTEAEQLIADGIDPDDIAHEISLMGFAPKGGFRV